MTVQTPSKQKNSANRPAIEPRVLLSHPTGNQNVRNALLSLVEHKMFAEFWTTVQWPAHSPWNRLMPGRLRAQLARRSFGDAPRGQVRSVPWRETMRLTVRSTPLWKLLSTGERPLSVIGVYRHFDRRVARRIEKLSVDVVYAYEGGALETFRAAKRLGVTTCYELPSTYWYWEHKFLSSEAERNPSYSELLPKLKDPPGHMRWKDEELALADYVFVPSEHVGNTLEGVVPASRIRIVNYGAPAPRHDKQISLDKSRPLQVLFVGMLHQRKGIGYLLDAIDMLGGQVELTLVGRRYRPHARVDAACRRWRWFESLPHAKVLDLMQEADVLVLPSLTEAFGLVVTEALSCGLPVIVSLNTGASELIRDGCEGFVVPAAQAEAIADRLHVLNCNRELLRSMSRAAQATAAEKSWERYRACWADAVRSVPWR